LGGSGFVGLEKWVLVEYHPDRYFLSGRPAFASGSRLCWKTASGFAGQLPASLEASFRLRWPATPGQDAGTRRRGKTARQGRFPMAVAVPAGAALFEFGDWNGACGIGVIAANSPLDSGPAGFGFGDVFFLSFGCPVDILRLLRQFPHAWNTSGCIDEAASGQGPGM
jgi:hypothetical protein